MKKLLLIVLICLISTLNYSNIKIDSLSKIIPDSANITFSKVYSDVKSGLAGLSGALKVGAEHVYQIIVKQQVANSIIWLLIGILPLFVLLAFGKTMWMWASKTSSDSEGFTVFVAFLFFAITILPSIFMLFNINEMVTGFYNPEYGAIKEIMEFTK